MREDMAKVIVERPRYGSRASKKRKGYSREWDRYALDEQPKREGIKKRSGGTKHLNEHLAPLRRYLFAQVGRPWDKVFAEICEHIDRNSAVQDHVRDHVADYVVTKVKLIDGVPHYGEGPRVGHPISSGWFYRDSLYVCPKTGILRQVKAKKTSRQPRPSSVVPPVRESLRLQYHYLEGAWHEVKLTPIPPGVICDYLTDDVLLKRPLARISPVELQSLYGADVHASAIRRLSDSEAQALLLPAVAKNRLPQVLHRRKNK